MANNKIKQIQVSNAVYDIEPANNTEVDFEELIFDSLPTANSTNVVTSGGIKTYVDGAIAELPKAMIFRGTIGTGGTIQTLPTATQATEGDVYKVITAGTYDGKAAQVGDLFICGLPTGSSTYQWFLVSGSGATSQDTWRAIKVNDTQLLGTSTSSGPANFKAGSNISITGSGNDITISSSYTDTNTAHTHTNGVGLIKTGNGGVSGEVSYKAALVDETLNSNSSSKSTSTSGGLYAVEADKDGKLAVRVPWTDTQKQADWDQTDTSAIDYIKNKPTIIKNVKVNNTSVVSDNEANLNTINNDYNASSNKLATANDLLDTNVKLSTELKTYYNIGKIQNASGTNPVVIGNAGDTLRKVLENLTKMDEAQPTKTDPSITSISFSSTASDEYGTEITSVNYSITKNNGYYTYDSSTGVTWSKYTFSGGCASTDKTSTSDSLALSSTYTVGTSNSVAFSCTGTHSAGNIAKTNLGNNSNPPVQIVAGTKLQTGSFSKTSVLYPYYKITTSETTPTSGLTKSTNTVCYTNGIETGSSPVYVYFYVQDGYSYSQIKYKDGTSWNNTPTTSLGTVTITLNSGKTKSYKVYRTDTTLYNVTLRIN